MGVTAIKVFDIDLCFIETSLGSESSCVFSGMRWMRSELVTASPLVNEPPPLPGLAYRFICIRRKGRAKTVGAGEEIFADRLRVGV